MTQKPYRDGNPSRIPLSTSASLSRASRRRIVRRRPWYETLESRRMLANYTWNDAADTLLISLGNDESLTVSETGAVVSFGLSTGMFTKWAGDTATGDGTAQININASDLASSVQINNFTAIGGATNVAFSGTGSLSSTGISVVLIGPLSVGTISTTGGFDLTSTGSGGISLVSRRNISIGNGTDISSTSSGNISFRAGKDSPAVDGNFVGIDIDGATITTSGSGIILMDARGGDSGGFNHGVRIANGAKLQSTSAKANAGTITIDGTGGIGTNADPNRGVQIGGTNTTVTSVRGDIQIIGRGGGHSGEGNDGNSGVSLESAQIRSFGRVQVQGTGGGAESSNGNSGVYVNSGVIGGGNNVTVTGQGGNATGALNVGVYVAGPNSKITSIVDMQVTGIAAPNQEAVRLDNSGEISSVTDIVTLVADSLQIVDNNSKISADVAVFIEPRTAGTQIDIGGSDVLTGSPLTWD